MDKVIHPIDTGIHEGQKYEFRHDQMRAYLAAYWWPSMKFSQPDYLKLMRRFGGCRSKIKRQYGISKGWFTIKVENVLKLGKQHIAEKVA